MKKQNIAMILALVILLCITLIGTYGYQMYTQDTLKNTFIVGDVKVELYEKNPTGARMTDLDQQYVLARGETYSKNMLVNVGAGSEAGYVYIVMQNDLALAESEAITSTKENPDIEAYTPVAEQIEAYGWEERITQTENIKIYWQKFEKNTGDSYDLEFMECFRTSEDYDHDSVVKGNDSLPVISFKLYAIERASLTEAQAWAMLQREFTELGSY